MYIKIDNISLVTVVFSFVHTRINKTISNTANIEKNRAKKSMKDPAKLCFPTILIPLIKPLQNRKQEMFPYIKGLWVGLLKKKNGVKIQETNNEHILSAL